MGFSAVIAAPKQQVQQQQVQQVEQQTCVYTPSAWTEMVDDLKRRAVASCQPGRTTFIALAGAPGSGKSTLAEAIVEKLNAEEEIAVVLPMDGYHIPRRELKHMGSRGLKYGEDRYDPTKECTTYADLLARRGSPWTFDPKLLYQDFSQAKANGYANLPTYSRVKSDPVPGGVQLCKHHRIAICEGNYLLSHDDDDWKPLQSLWDEMWFLYIPQEEVIMERLIGRHLVTWNDEKTELWGAPGREGAKRKAMANDLKNARYIQECSKKFAELVIEVQH
eukprot:CAMPEP_0118693916 /NCGR_PEP_ID=MMETSP0800-20121206/12194_1 /TAXON_ID=210618 ORGANISM="Striatella unipunctata, Strain CCMP2910" /NCGR_SAMPLE_ID=MMETSP0800 /ASSEMBLY_ACC=CAM_ASM_000638 /LENGTH=276 /DNA_ID=CAMNT_0006592245 /DNA_START=90 /DNA_END=920 /DNA_ORIENTATION=+